MDHLPLPVDEEKHIQVKCYVFSEPSVFHPNDFFDRLLKNGYQTYKIDDLLQDGLNGSVALAGQQTDWSQSDIRQANEFLQKWLFFGLISTVLGLEIKADDFRKDGNLSTKNLKTFIEKWESQLATEVPEDVKERKALYLRGGMALNCAREFVSQHLAYASHWCLPFEECKDRKMLKGMHGHIDKRTSLAIAALGETLQSIRREKAPEMEKLFESWTEARHEEKSWGNSAYCRQKMFDRGWCAHDAHFVESTMRTVGAVYYTTGLDAMRPTGDQKHSQCQAQECRVPRVRQSAFHMTKNCDCNKPVVVEAIEADVMDSKIREGLTPLVRCSNGKNDIEIEYHDLRKDKTVNFAALSHGWSDGLFQPPPDDNINLRQILRCQLEAMQASTDQALKRDPVRVERNQLFWIDCLCFPKQPTTTDTALSQLKNIFTKARAVVVWDRHLLRSRLQHEDQTIEMTVRIRTSRWSRRLWTLLEAVVARVLYFEFASGRLLSSVTIAQAMQEAKENPLSEYHHAWKLGQLFGPAVDKLRMKRITETVKDTRFETGPRSRRYSVASQQLYAVDKMKKEVGDYRVHRTWQAAQFRRCDEAPEDEAIVLANVMGIRDVSPIEAIKDVTATRSSHMALAARRMAKLLELMDATEGLGIPAGFIFTPQAKSNGIERKGVGGVDWAPVSWLSQQVHNARLVPALRTQACLMKHGLQVEFPGILLHLPCVDWAEPPLWIPVSQSLHAWYKVVFDVHEVARVSWKHFFDEHLKNAKEPSIIMSGFEEPRERWEVGVLVRAKGDRLHAGTIRRVEVLCRVFLRLETKPDIIQKMRDIFRQNPTWMGFGEKLPTTKWCVDGGGAEG
jgi:hypothetical protein